MKGRAAAIVMLLLWGCDGPGGAPISPATQADLDARELPGGHLSVGELVRAQGPLFAAVCEAMGDADVRGAWDSNCVVAAQSFRVVLPLAGGMRIHERLVLKYGCDPDARTGERLIRKGEKVIWIMGMLKGYYTPMKAVPDTPRNREAIRDLLGEVQ